MNEALIKEARKDAKVFKGLAVGDLLGRLADALEAADKRTHRHAARGNRLSEELEESYDRITGLTRQVEDLTQD